ncbi:hypothetical protein Q649_01184 [Bartonella quintana JK 73]|uniref:Uncharacterized protein n=1 Tax=Bartonella quintana JK 73 TaxID=1402976 RepID=W3TY00_BARQI|nr:hypothetical protein [Bartonella quintana]ETS14535.1 hypothetical protein Q650_01176 [Bartonella quintana JK 73rel]ETS16221.1 hypothetical protein Q649_01184 [Bartonella quintana JK 73]QUG71697.1 hypothetical protein FOL54_00585 [Bartonella quintana]
MNSGVRKGSRIRFWKRFPRTIGYDGEAVRIDAAVVGFLIMLEVLLYIGLQAIEETNMRRRCWEKASQDSTLKNHAMVDVLSEVLHFFLLQEIGMI